MAVKTTPVPARALVCVVADDRCLRNAPVHAAVDPGKARCDLVDRAVEIVDTRLERDGEVDEVGLPAAEQDHLRLSDTPELERHVERDRQRDRRCGARADRDPRRRRGRDIHGARS
jgi:hypothetical protein